MIGGGVLVVIAVIVGFLMTQKAEAPVGLESENTNERTGVMDSARTSLSGLLALGKSQKCTFRSSAETADSSGVVYISGGKVRGDFDSTTKVGTNVSTVKSHMITDGDEIRVWSDGEEMGMLMKTAQAPSGAVDTQVQNTAPMPLDMNDSSVDYDCDMWVADASVFTPPSSVTFQSIDDMMKQAMPKGGMMQIEGSMGAGMDMEAMKAMQCSACDSAPDAESKAQCKQALQCS